MGAGITRRELLASGLVAGTAVGGAGSVFATQRVASPTRLSLNLALFDSRFAAGHAFGRAMASHGVQLAPYAGDVTPVWYNQLDRVWRQQPLAVAGLTTEGALFCLEQFAWDHGMRVAYRGCHELTSNGSATHLLEASGQRAHVISDKLDGVLPWPAQVANLILQIDQPQPAFPSEPHQRASTTVRSRLRSGSDDMRLVSWLIAPKTWRAPQSANV